MKRTTQKFTVDGLPAKQFNLKEHGDYANYTVKVKLPNGGADHV
jgi:hypothetical protein